MVDHRKFILKVTAGSSYDLSKQREVKVNTSEPIKISSDELDATIRVRIKNYRGTATILDMHQLELTYHRPS